MDVRLLKVILVTFRFKLPSTGQRVSYCLLWNRTGMALLLWWWRDYTPTSVAPGRFNHSLSAYRGKCLHRGCW